MDVCEEEIDSLTEVVAVSAHVEQDRCLPERSRDASSAEVVRLNEELRCTTERLEAEREELRQANSLLSATLESTSDAILVAGGEEGIRSVNGRFVDMWGVPQEILDRGSDEELLQFVLGQLRDPDTFLATVRELAEAPEASSRDFVEFLDGRMIERISLPQRIDGEIVGRVWSLRDVTEQQRLQKELVHQAFHDHLTGLANRALLTDRVEQALKRATRSGDCVAVIVIDLDGFKNVNDGLGHLSGDALLVEVANRFRRTLRDVDTVARIGGDEFAVLVDGGCSQDTAEKLGQRVLESLDEPAMIDNRAVAVSASVGIALAHGDVSSAERLLRDADAAMYRAKREGKGRCRLFEPWMHTAALELLEIEQELRAAVDSMALRIHYQPVVAAESGAVTSFEALARWESPTHGSVPPDVFIPLAEETGLIVDLGRMVLREACRQAKRWWDCYPSVCPGVAVNVSRRQLIEPGFAGDVSAALADAGLPASALTLEVTETALGADPELVAAVLGKVRSTGVRVAIDDFGTGTSSLAALADLPIDTLKIDKRFIDNLVRDDSGRGLVRAITQLARILALDTTAEGVEQAEQRDALEALGCDRIQGYLYARPLRATDTYGYIEDSIARGRSHRRGRSRVPTRAGPGRVAARRRRLVRRASPTRNNG